MVHQLNVKAAEEHLNSIRIHNVEAGGTMFGIVGSKGCGKTHLMTRLSHQILFIHPKHKRPMQETVIWRGRNIDYWNFMFHDDFEWENPIFKRKLIIHYWRGDEDNITFRTELGEDLPPFIRRTYVGVKDLYDNLSQGDINVVYEPSRYIMSPGMEEMICKRSLVSAKSLQEIEMDPSLWWSEFMFFLLHFKTAGFITVFLDEIDEIFPATSQGLRWHIQALFADSAKDFRKANISLIFSIHDLSDLDYRLRSKIQYWGYMRGAVPHTSSLLKPSYTLLLPIGEIVIDRGTYGNTNLGPLKSRPRVRVSFKHNSGNPDKWVSDDMMDLIDENIVSDIELDEMECPSCNYRWSPKTDYPTRCPKCRVRLIYFEEEY